MNRRDFWKTMLAAALLPREPLRDALGVTPPVVPPALYPTVGFLACEQPGRIIGLTEGAFDRILNKIDIK